THAWHLLRPETDEASRELGGAWLGARRQTYRREHHLASNTKSERPRRPPRRPPGRSDGSSRALQEIGLHLFPGSTLIRVGPDLREALHEELTMPVGDRHR